MYYTAQIDRFETEQWAVVRVGEVYYYVLAGIIPQGAVQGDRILALVTQGKVRAIIPCPN